MSRFEGRNLIARATNTAVVLRVLCGGHPALAVRECANERAQRDCVCSARPSTKLNIISLARSWPLCCTRCLSPQPHRLCECQSHCQGYLPQLRMSILLATWMLACLHPGAGRCTFTISVPWHQIGGQSLSRSGTTVARELRVRLVSSKNSVRSCSPQIHSPPRRIVPLVCRPRCQIHGHGPTRPACVR